MTGPPATSVVVATRERPGMARDAVRSVLAGRRRPDEVVVVDQSAVPALAELEREAGVRYLWRPGRGASRARNTGAHAARGEVVAFLDDDVVAGPDWLAALVDALTAAGPRTVVTGRVVAGEPEVPGGWAPSTLDRPEPRRHTGRTAGDVLYTACMAVHRTTLEQVGPFDERLGPGSAFPAAEDNDLCYRLLTQGFAVDYCPQAVVVHRAWRPGGDLLGLRYRYGRGQGGFYAKHARAGDRYAAGRLRADVARHALRAARRLPRDRRASGADAAYVAGLLAGAVSWPRS